MRVAIFALTGFVLLAGCGVDGAPIRPEPKEQPETGLRIEGSVGVGVVGGSTNIRYSN